MSTAASVLTPLRRRVLLVALLISIGLLTGPPSASAQEPPPGGAPQVVQSWAVTPTGANPGEPSSRPALTFDAAAGATVNDSVTLWNYSNVQLTFRLYATDAYNNVDGAFDLLPGDQQPKDVGSWITVPQPFVTVPASSRVDLPISVTVPAGATPGDHAGAILASNEAAGTGPDGKVVTLDRRTGTRVYIRVGGPLEPKLTVTKAHSVYHGSLDPRKGELDVTYTVRNVGNVRLGATQAVRVKSIFGRTMETATPDPIVELLPGNEVAFHRRFAGIAATVRVGADIDITPTGGGGAGDTTASVASRTASTWAVPWVLLLVALAAVALFRGVRWYRQRSDTPNADPGRPPESVPHPAPQPSPQPASVP